MSFRTALIVQARMGSSRLPGKVLLEVLGKTLLEYQIERLRLSREIDQIIIATTTLKMDNPIVSLCEKLGVAYVSNILSPTYPTGFHTEAFSINALEAAFENAHQAEEREHVTPYIYRNPQIFNLLNIAIDRDLSKIRLTIDYPEDFKVVTKIIEGLYPANPKFDMDDMLKFLDLNPEILKINSQFTKKATV